MCKWGVEYVPMHLFTSTKSVMEYQYLRYTCEGDRPTCRKLTLHMYASIFLSHGRFAHLFICKEGSYNDIGKAARWHAVQYTIETKSPRKGALYIHKRQPRLYRLEPWMQESEHKTLGIVTSGRPFA